MATAQQNLARFQEIANRGLEDNLDSDKRARFDEALKRGLINQDSAPEPSFVEKAIGVGDAALAIGSSIVGEIAGGAAGFGVAQSKAPFPEGEGARVSESISEALTYDPRTEEGKANLEAIAGSDIIQTITSAMQTAEDTLGDAGAELGGPNVVGAILGTIGKVIPTAILEGMGLIGVKGAAKVPGAIEKAAGATGTALTTLQPKLKAAAIEGTELVSDATKFKTQAKRDIIEQLRSGDLDKDLARVKLDESQVITDPTQRQIEFGADLPRVVKDKPAAEAVKQGFSNKFVEFFKKKATTTDRKLVAEMTNNSQRGKKDAEFGFDNRPADVPGRVLLDQVNEIKKINRIAGKRIGDAGKFLTGKKVPTAQIGDSFRETLESLKVVVTPEGKLDFTDSIISGLGGRKSAINEIWGKMVRNKDPDAMDLHELKQAIDENISYGKSVRGLGGKAEGALRELRVNIKKALDKFPEYKEANKVYSDTINVLDEMQRLAGRKTDLTGDSASGQLGTLARRLTSNAQSRGPLRELVKQLSEVLDKHSGFGGPKRLEGKSEGRANLKILLQYANELDKVVGTPADTSLGGVVGDVLEFAKDVPTAVVSPLAATISAGAKFAKKPFGINEEGAFKAIRELLKEGK